MEAATLWVSIGAMAVAGIAAVAAIVQANAAVAARIDAQTAQTAAESARNETRNIAEDANDLLQRQAEAAERAVELEEAKSRPSVKWQISRAKGDTQIVENVGELRAYKVRLSGTEGVWTDEDSSRDEVGPGDSVEFAVWQGSGMSTPRLTIHWRTEPDGAEFSDSVAVRAR